MTAEPGQADEEPPIVPGCDGSGVTVTVDVRAELFPQPLLATTETTPLVEPVVTTILFVVDEPVQPDGNVHM